MSYTPMDLVGQFIVCKTEDHIPTNWHIRKNGQWLLGSHPGLPVIDILDKDDRLVAWLFGYPITPDGKLEKNRMVFSNSATVNGFESDLYGYGGRYAAVYLEGPETRFYLDPCGLLSAVYCRSSEIVASTTTLIPSDESCPDRLMPELRVPESDRFYPFGLTTKENVERIVPNHFLDMDRWETLRHWPKEEISPIRNTSAAVAEFTEIVRRHINAVTSEQPTHMNLTAGRDTRVLLACARTRVNRVAFVTGAVPVVGGRLHESGRIDCEVAGKIARRFNLNHTIMPHRPATDQDLKQYLHRTGHCVGSWHNIRTSMQMDPEKPLLTGIAGELGRGFHWRRGDSETSTVMAEDLLKRRDLPLSDPLLERARQWLEELPVKNTLSIWGLMYIEQLMGCWSGPSLYGWVTQPFSLSPFVHRRCMEIMLGLPTEYRKELRFEKDIIEHEWPELMRWPFNWPTGFNRIKNYIRRRTGLFR